MLVHVFNVEECSWNKTFSWKLILDNKKCSRKETNVHEKRFNVHEKRFLFFLTWDPKYHHFWKLYVRWCHMGVRWVLDGVRWASEGCQVVAWWFSDGCQMIVRWVSDRSDWSEGCQIGLCRTWTAKYALKSSAEKTPPL